MSIVHTVLTDRRVLRISGDDRVDFLQNLITQNVTNLPDGACVMAALLTPQGKVLHDFLLLRDGDSFLLDCAADSAEALLKKLSLYKLRAAVDIAPTEMAVHALWQEDGYPCPPMAGFVDDPRHAGLGLRGYFTTAPTIDLPSALLTAWHSNRLKLGVPQGPSDMPPGTVFPLEFGLQHLQAIDFKKGCFIGQEVTSRTHRKGSLRKKLHVVTIDGPAPDLGSDNAGDIMAGERIVGQLVTRENGLGLALIREDSLALELTLEQTHGEAKITPTGGVFADEQ